MILTDKEVDARINTMREDYNNPELYELLKVMVRENERLRGILAEVGRAQELPTHSKDYKDGFKDAYRLGPASLHAQIFGKEIADQINASTRRIDGLQKEKEMSKIATYSKDYIDGFKTAYILGPASALAQIHKWEPE